jgi:hypothetical protein
VGGVRLVLRRRAVSSIVPLAETILDEGSRSPNWFNGRLVTAEAMKQDRKAVREGLRSLGRIAGGGVAFGLEVSTAVGQSTPTKPVVTIRAGLAVNARGHVLRLCSDAAVSLLTVRSTDQATGNGFKDCTPAQAGVYVAGEGVYLLAMSPAAAKQGRAVASGLGNAPVSCDAAYVVDGVSFRLVPIPLTQAVLDDVAHLRNRLAYAFFAVEAAAAAAKDPFGLPPVSESPLEALIGTKAVTDCDVPLAVVYWTAAGLQFLDMWAVRRRLMPGRERRQVETHAMCAQFQQHLTDLLAAEASPDEHRRHRPLPLPATLRHRPPPAGPAARIPRAQLLRKRRPSSGRRLGSGDRVHRRAASRHRGRAGAHARADRPHAEGVHLGVPPLAEREGVVRRRAGAAVRRLPLRPHAGPGHRALRHGARRLQRLRELLRRFLTGEGPWRTLWRSFPTKSGPATSSRRTCSTA